MLHCDPSEMRQIIDLLKNFYDNVRLVKPENCRELYFKKNGDIAYGEVCFSRGVAEQYCHSCAGYHALRGEDPDRKYELFETLEYFAQAVPVCIRQTGSPAMECVMELMLSKKNPIRTEKSADGVLLEQLIAIRAQLYEDSLTKAYNRRFYDERVFLNRITLPCEVVFLMTDLKRFKSINDRYGHPVGDIALAKTAQAIRDSVRSSDMVIRVGGDEFLVILPGASEHAAEQIAGNLRESIRNVLLGDSIRDGLKINIGYAYMERFDGSERSIAELYVEADRKMYLDKREGNME